MGTGIEVGARKPHQEQPALCPGGSSHVGGSEQRSDGRGLRIWQGPFGCHGDSW